MFIACVGLKVLIFNFFPNGLLIVLFLFLLSVSLGLSERLHSTRECVLHC